jgi:hypothetical protein
MERRRESTYVSLDAMDWVWSHSHSKGVARLVLLAIADKSTGPACKAYAGLTFLQDRSNAGRSTVIAALRELADSGELEIVDGEKGRHGAAVYRLPKALGHVQHGADGPHGSVQKLHQSGRGPKPRIGAVSAPIDAPSDHQIGAGSAPIQGGEISAESAPIRAEAEPKSVQILDSIGADSAPQHQTPKEQKRYISAAAPPSRTRATADPRTPRHPDAFDAFWTAYPKKDSKPAAIKAWNAALTRAADPSALIAAATAYRDWAGRDPAYTKNPATWLNNDCWNDELPAPRTTRATPVPSVRHTDDDYRNTTWR